MEHPCHKCGQPVEDGVAFCSHCGAPQIRVAIAQAAPDPGIGSEAVSAPDHSGVAGSPPLTQGSFAVLWHHALPACAIAALVAALLMCLGLMVPFLAMLGAGFLAVVLYRRRTFGAPVKASTGAQLGAVSGLLSSGMAAIMEAVAVAVLRSGAQVRSKMLEAVRQAASRTSDPQAQVVFDYFKTPAGMAVMMIFVLIFALVFFVALGSVGGALGGVFFGRRDRK
jgi:zinc ribbon protein